MKYLIIAVLLLGGCSQLARIQDKSADRVAGVISKYCSETDQEFRNKLRAAINAKAAPHSIAVTCGE